MDPRKRNVKARAVVASLHVGDKVRVVKAPVDFYGNRYYESVDEGRFLIKLESLIRKAILMLSLSDSLVAPSLTVGVTIW